MPKPLPALTIHQPWAWCIAGGWKPVENRDWPPPPGVVGKWLAIHAGRQYDEAAARELVANAEALRLPGPPPAAGRIALGAIVAVARVAGVVEVADFEGRLDVKRITGEVTEARALEIAASPWARGPQLWVLEGVVAIDPIPCRGFQKIWTVPAPIAEQVRDAYRARRAA